MSDPDWGRVYDLGMIKAELRRPTTTPDRKRQLEEIEYRIIYQLKNDKINELRSRLARATRAGDREAIDKLTKELQKASGE